MADANPVCPTATDRMIDRIPAHRRAWGSRCRLRADAWPRAVALVLAAGLSAGAAAQDEGRQSLVDLQLGSDPESLLRVVEQARLEPLAPPRGLQYLRGRLLVQVDRREEALQAYVSVISETPSLAAYSRYHLAETQAALGRADVAASLIADLLAGAPPRSLVAPALRLLQRSLRDGGDCRVLRGIAGSRIGQAGRRYLDLMRAVCAARTGDRKTAEAGLLALLASNPRDDIARQAAAAMVEGAVIDQESARVHMLLGLAFQAHSELDLAIQHLSRAIARLPEATDISPLEAHDLRYALARSHFRQGRFHVAAALFGALARDAHRPALRAQDLYQQARCLELDGRFDQAIAGFQRAHQAEPEGGWSSSALLSMLRLDWRRGREGEALAVLRTLEARRRSPALLRALLFMASSDLVQGRAQRSGPWLTTAARMASDAAGEVAYWQGRHRELEGDQVAAVAAYRMVLERDPYDPFAGQARSRLAQPRLQPIAARLGYRLARSNRLRDLYAAWLLLGDGDAVGRAARETLRTRLEGDASASRFLHLSLVPPASWPLLRQPLLRPEEVLLALGLWHEGAPAVMRHFPVSEPRLAFTGSLMLARAGETRRSLYIAEILDKRKPARLPAGLVPDTFRRLLYPFRFGYLILREAQRQDIDPYLLSAIIREESRFDPRALSAAAARGLTQFVLPTARRLAGELGRETTLPEDLEQPEVAIALGARYLHDLAAHFGGDTAQMIAAYNAGEPQTEAWKRSCFSNDPAEFYTKVTFRETRGYLEKVLTSLAHYRELYARSGA